MGKTVPFKDDFGMRCRKRTREGKRCRRRVTWLIPLCASRESWLAALRTGWPRLVLGMKEPDYHTVGVCRIHGLGPRPFPEGTYLYGVGKLRSMELDEEYEAARKEGDAACQ